MCSLQLPPPSPHTQITYSLAPPVPPCPLAPVPCPAPADIMRFLLSHVDELGPEANQTLEQLGLLTGRPVGRSKGESEGRGETAGGSASWHRRRRCCCAVVWRSMS